MANYLYRLGLWSAQRARIIIGLWAVILIAAIGLGTLFAGPVSDSLSIPGTDSQRAIDLLNKEFPQANGGEVRLILAMPEGKRLTDQSTRQVVGKMLDEAAKDKAIIGIASPYESGALSA